MSRMKFFGFFSGNVTNIHYLEGEEGLRAAVSAGEVTLV